MRFANYVVDPARVEGHARKISPPKTSQLGKTARRRLAVSRTQHPQLGGMEQFGYWNVNAPGRRTEDCGPKRIHLSPSFGRLSDWGSFRPRSISENSMKTVLVV